VLDGDGLAATAISLDGEALPLSPDLVSPDRLTITQPPGKPFELVIDTTVNPSANTQLMGLYRSGSAYCTQCEAEGFRRITYFLDRPDVLIRVTPGVHAHTHDYISTGQEDSKFGFGLASGAAAAAIDRLRRPDSPARLIGLHVHIAEAAAQAGGRGLLQRRDPQPQPALHRGGLCAHQLAKGLGGLRPVATLQGPLPHLEKGFTAAGAAQRWGAGAHGRPIRALNPMALTTGTTGAVKPCPTVPLAWGNCCLHWLARVQQL
jgi:hypothetical protein